MAKRKNSNDARYLAYVCTPQMVREPGGRVRKAYKFNVIDTGGDRPRLLCVVNDVCATSAQARELEELFRRNNIALCHVKDVLEDWLARQ